MSARGGDAPAASTAKHRRDCLPAVPRSPQVFTSWRQLKPGQVVFDRVKDMPCMVIRARGNSPSSCGRAASRGRCLCGGSRQRLSITADSSTPWPTMLPTSGAVKNTRAESGC